MGLTALFVYNQNRWYLPVGDCIAGTDFNMQCSVTFTFTCFYTLCVFRYSSNLIFCIYQVLVRLFYIESHTLNAYNMTYTCHIINAIMQISRAERNIYGAKQIV